MFSQGMRETISRDRPFIICEVLPRDAQEREDAEDGGFACGYTPYWITSSGYIRVSQFDFAREDST